MPTLPISAALLLLGSTDGLPWNSTSWQQLTKIADVPWKTPADALPESSAPHVKDWTAGLAQSVKTYAENLWAQGSLAAHVHYAKHSFTNNDAQGRKAWTDWVSGNWNRTWKINKIIDDVFLELKCGPYDTLARFKTKKFPTLETSQATNLVTNPLAYKLLGEDAYADGDPMFIRTEVKEFVDNLIVNTWHRYRKAITREAGDIKKKRAFLDKEWEALTADGAHPSMKMMRMYLVGMRSLMTILRRYRDNASLQELEDQKKRIEAMLAAAQNDDSKREDVEKLPKVLRDALKKLASEQEIREVKQLVQAALDNIEVDESSLEIPDGETIDFPWQEGVEDLRKMTEEDLWCHLGVKDHLPFFQEFTDPDGVIEPWSKEGEQWLTNPDTTREPLLPRWHQLVGILRMLQRAFTGQPVLLMDGVGIGKTFQVIGFISCLAYYRVYFETHSQFPGLFANQKWQGREGNIPDLPFLVVCPVNLHNQWQREIERFLRRGTFDILPYFGRHVSRQEWWSTVKTKSRQQLSRQIILATDMAIQDDALKVFIDLIRTVEDSPKRSSAYASQSQKTVIRICLAVSENSIRDLWIMGSVLGIPAFADKTKFDDMNKGLNRAQAKDRRAERESETSGNRLRSLLGGERASEDVGSSELAPILRQWVPWLRENFGKHVIHRTLDSVNYRGEKIFGLPSYTEHALLLQLRPWETSRLKDITDNLVGTSAGTLSGAGKNFYIEFRRTLLHPHMNPRGGNDCWVTPESLAKWRSDYVSTKLDVLAEIVAYHLNKDSAPPLKVLENGIAVAPVDTQAPNNYTGKDPDRIVIFSAFPSSNAAIIDVLSLHGIKAIELNGKTPPSKRKRVLNEFRASTKDEGGRVLILSSVGMVGLNLACANIMVIVDTLWSALEDEQLRGRIYRYPQPKQVHFYRLVARNTPDVFLNNIAFDKWNLHKAFVGLDPQSRSLFTGRDGDDNDGDDDDVTESEVPDVDNNSEPIPRNKKGKKKQRLRLPQPATPPRPATKRANPLSPPSADRAPRRKKKTKPSPHQKQPGSSTSAPRDPIPDDVFVSSGAPSTSTTDVEMADSTTARWNPNTDQIYQEMQRDPNWQLDPDQLHALAELQLQGDKPNKPSSPLTPPPPSSPQREVAPSSSAGPLQPSTPHVEQISAAPLVPGGEGRGKGRQRGRGRKRRGNA